MPALLDQVDDAVSKAYASFPDRLYLIGKDGKIAYAGARGPLGFKPAELEKAIEIALAPAKQAERRDI
jgi:Iodothyronine deiodinase